MRRVRIFAGLDFRERLHGCTQLVEYFTARKAMTHKPFSTPISSGQSPEPLIEAPQYSPKAPETHITKDIGLAASHALGGAPHPSLAAAESMAINQSAPLAVSPNLVLKTPTALPARLT